MMPGPVRHDGNRLRFHIGLVYGPSPIGAFNDYFGLAPARLDITGLEVRFIADILRQGFFLGLLLNALFGYGCMRPATCNLGDLSFAACARKWGIRLQRDQRIDDDGQRLVLDINGGSAIFGGLLRLAQHYRDRVAAPVYLAVRQRGLGARGAVSVSHTKRLTRIHGHNARDRLGRYRINRDDTGMRVRAEHQPGMHQPGKRQVACVTRTPGQFLGCVLTTRRLTNRSMRCLVNCLSHQESISIECYNKYQTIVLQYISDSDGYESREKRSMLSGILHILTL